ncbi:hypothetical protein WJX84_000928 [Apatococcus fuscideae]|uniref:WIBG Mago-binding domain-containing protein n=1 Tax=Apatococcus fuscideae TaxID=2026836 RepID=A0AAW1T2T4_9CHLO
MSTSSSSQNDRGERVIQGSRRPDGTYRKEVRVKAGYVPPDEQAAFTSRGSQFRNGPGRVPGLVLDDQPAQPAVRAKGKSAKRNEAKRKKKEEEVQQMDGKLAFQTADLRLEDGGDTSSPPQTGAAPRNLSNSNTGGSQQPQAAGPFAALPTDAATSRAATGAAAGDQANLEKRLRALRKKLRQVEGLIEKQANESTLTQEERSKVEHASQW